MQNLKRTKFFASGTLGRWRIALTGLLAAMWLFSGVQKLIDPAAFIHTVKHHEVVSDQVAKVAWILGVAEMALGVALIVTFGRRWAFRITIWIAVGMLALFCLYLVQVSAAALAQFGCGCDVLIRRALESGAQSRNIMIAADIVLIAAHLSLVFERKAKLAGRSKRSAEAVVVNGSAT